MSNNNWLEQCAKRFLELGCPMPVATECGFIPLETPMECDGSVNETSSYRRAEERDV